MLHRGFTMQEEAHPTWYDDRDCEKSKGMTWNVRRSDGDYMYRLRAGRTLASACAALTKPRLHAHTEIGREAWAEDARIS